MSGMTIASEKMMSSPQVPLMPMTSSKTRSRACSKRGLLSFLMSALILPVGSSKVSMMCSFLVIPLSAMMPMMLAFSRSFFILILPMLVRFCRSWRELKILWIWR